MVHACAAEAPTAVRTAASLEALRQIWVQQYYLLETAGVEPKVSMRNAEDLPPAENQLCSPYDVDARYARHNDKEWIGYRTHFTESCDPEAPIHLITHVETVLAPTQGVEVCETIYADLEQQNLKPQTCIVDAAYVSANLLANAAKAGGIELVGPAKKLQDVSWQACKQTGYDFSQFKIDWDNQQVTCPQGQASSEWNENGTDSTGNAVVHVAFSASICNACPVRAACTRSKQGGCNTLFARALSMKHSSKHVRRKTTKPSSADTEPAWGSKAPSPKLSEPMNSAGHVIWAWRRRIYMPLHWPRLSTYLGFGTIYAAQVSARQGSHSLPPW